MSQFILHFKMTVEYLNICLFNTFYLFAYKAHFAYILSLKVWQDFSRIFKDA